MVQKCNRQMAAVLMVLSLGLPGSAEAEVFWEDGFELPATWSNPSCGVDNPILAPTSAFKRTGTKSMQEYFTGHPPNYEGGGSCYSDRSFTPTDTLYSRWWMYLTDHAGTGDFLVGTPTTKLTLQFPDNCSTCYSVWWVMPLGSLKLEAAIQHADQSAQTVHTSGTIPQQKWVCVETRLTAESPPGAANGVVQAWIDDVEVVNDTGRTLLKSGGAGPLANVRLYTQNGLGTIFYDDFATGNTRIGCGAADLTAPAAPAGLMVQ